MVDLPRKKVGIVACSGEELPEGTVTRLAALKVLEGLRPADTVTICLPLFLAGGEGDRAFARFYPTIAVDGCELRCARRATEMYSSKPAASVMVRDLIAETGIGSPGGKRRLNTAGLQAVEITAERIASLVDQMLGKTWDRRTGTVMNEADEPSAPQETFTESEKIATCTCGSGIPTLKVMISDQETTLIALPLIFEQFKQAGKIPSETTARELLDSVRIYTPVPAELDERYAQAILREYSAYYDKEFSK